MHKRVERKMRLEKLSVIDCKRITAPPTQSGQDRYGEPDGMNSDSIGEVAEIASEDDPAVM